MHEHLKMPNTKYSDLNTVFFSRLFKKPGILSETKSKKN